MTRSTEDYLKTILILQKQCLCVLKTDVAEAMGYTRPSVTMAVKKLQEQGYLERGGGRYLRLTEQGRRLAERTYERPEVFTHMLQEAGVNPAQADADACQLEHAISDESFAALKAAMRSHGIPVWQQDDLTPDKV